ncbi:MAG: response regulator [Desulfuromonadaceae bacterium]|nr:response regulator [Desulfuromonadaceae bacterium]MDD2855446.1 response regulator [Desulfuromonadaceae bacterium]
MTENLSGLSEGSARATCIEEEQARQIEILIKENNELRKKVELKSIYIRSKVNQLLDMMGTLPLKTEELDDDMLVEFDPLGIISESFKKVLANLNSTNTKLHIAHKEILAIFDAADVGILHIDKNKTVLSHNNKLKELFFPEKDEGKFSNCTCSELICGNNLPAEGCSFNQIIEGKSKARLRHWTHGDSIFDVIGTPLLDNDGQVDSIVLVYHNITELKKVEEDRRENIQFIEELLKNAPVGIRVFDGESGRCLLLNHATAEIAGGDPETMWKQNFRNLESWKNSGLLKGAEAVLADGVTRILEVEMLTSFGRQPSVEYIISRFDVHKKPHLLVIGRDITAEKQLEDKSRTIEAQMLHVQKLESLGVLAGGIAHDFNNILLAILGNAELALMRLTTESPARKNLHQIEKAAQRAADLAQQMLAYSGRGHFVIEELDINAIIREMNQILEVSVSKKAAMRLNLADNLPFFQGDATQIRQIIMNLVINASDAIGDESGIINVKTGFMNCDQAYLSKIWLYDSLEAGDYIFFEISDSGCGMSHETMAKIFDPFFTTKFTGRGLGMAAVLGIVRGHRAAITLYSEPEKGSCFKVLLPATSSTSLHSDSITSMDKPTEGSGFILLVDDEEIILSLGREMLEELGYKVLTAKDGVEAVDIFTTSKEDILCVILDLTMPRLDGEQTYRELQRLDPNVQVIISSGFNEQEVSMKFVGKDLASFIQKPYKLAELSRKISDIHR